MTVSLNPTTLLAAASARTGTAGVTLPDDFVAAFRRLAISLDREGALTPMGRRLVQNQLLRMLRERRAIEAAPNAEWSTEPRVVVIVGLPRTGTTLLHHLLARCFTADFVPLPEALEPCGPPIGRTDGDDDDEDDGRRARAHAHLAFLDRLSPELRALHPMTVDGPEECDMALQLTGVSDWFSIAHRIPTYTRWVERVDRAGPYRTYRAVLARLRPRAEVLVLRSPSHLAHLGRLFDTFPQCRVVWLHRPAAQVVPSFVRLVRAARAVTGEPGGIAQVRAEWVPRLERRIDAARRWLDDPRVLHVHYDQLVGETEVAVKGIASHADLHERTSAPPYDLVRARLRRLSTTNAPVLTWPPDHGLRELDPLLA